MIERLVVFTASLSFSVRKGIVDIIEHYPDVQLLIAHQVGRPPVKRLVKNQWRNTQKHGWRWVPYQSKDIAGRIVQRVLPASRPAPGRPGTQYDWDNVAAHPNVEYCACHKLHDADTIERLRQFQPDLGVALAAPILKQELFGIPKLGTINLHKGKVPFYRGMPPAFWELWNGEQEVGCTVHKVEAGLDTGDILLETTVPVAKYSTVKGVQLSLDEVGVSLVTRALGLLNSGEAKWTPQPPGGKTYSSPTLKQLAELDRKLAASWTTPSARRLVKDTVFSGYAHVVRPIPRRVLGIKNAQRVVVVLYHRVNDDMRDSVTVGIEQFDRQMEIISQHYPLASIEQLVSGDIPRNTSRPIIAVTFDDGYLDNYENAVPSLLRHKVPAAFFVSTGIVDTDNGFPHDLDKLGKALPNMTWSQIEHMHRLGFTIGSHTVNHINCAKGERHAVLAEIAESKAALTERLGLDEIIFAYPFGKRDDINTDVLEYVKEIGYVGCTSAYGGVNKRAIDPFNILRMGIDANFTDSAFKARLEGFAS